MSADVGDKPRVRDKIAFIVLGIGMASIVAVSALALWLVTDSDRPEMARLVFASIIPLMGTWVGTVLAFYFARENLQSASDTTIRALTLAGAVTEESPVEAFMTRVDRIKPQKIVADWAAADALLLSDLFDSMTKSGLYRAPVFDTSGVALCVVHAFDIATYCAQPNRALANLGPQDTLGALRKGDPQKSVERLQFVPITANLKGVRDALAGNPGCKDVIVTKSGGSAEKAIGWITDADLARYT